MTNVIQADVVRRPRGRAWERVRRRIALRLGHDEEGKVREIPVMVRPWSALPTGSSAPLAPRGLYVPCTSGQHRDQSWQAHEVGRDVGVTPGELLRGVSAHDQRWARMYSLPAAMVARDTPDRMPTATPPTTVWAMPARASAWRWRALCRARLYHPTRCCGTVRVIVALGPDHPFIASLLRELHSVYGDALCSVALFGSVARRTARPDSDLDLMLVIQGLPGGRRARREAFRRVEDGLAAELDALAQAGIDTTLSPILRTPEELAITSPLLLDLTEDAVILEDRDGVLAAALDDLRQRLRRLGSRRIWTGPDEWYWDLKPDYRRGEIFRL